MTPTRRRKPKGYTAQLTGNTAKPSGEHLTSGAPAARQAATSSTAAGETSALKRKGEETAFALNSTFTITEDMTTTFLQILTARMIERTFLIFFRPPNLPQSAGERRLGASQESRDQLACGHWVPSKGVLPL